MITEKEEKIIKIVLLFLAGFIAGRTIGIMLRKKKDEEGESYDLGKTIRPKSKAKCDVKNYIKLKGFVSYYDKVADEDLNFAIKNKKKYENAIAKLNKMLMKCPNLDELASKSIMKLSIRRGTDTQRCGASDKDCMEGYQCVDYPRMGQICMKDRNNWYIPY